MPPQALFVLGIPIMLLELGLGQSRQKGFVVCLHEIHPGFAGLAWATVINSMLSCVFYNVIMAWSVLYLLNSVTQPAPALHGQTMGGGGLVSHAYA